MWPFCWRKYKNAVKNATSTEAKKEARKVYDTTLRDIKNGLIK